MHLSAVNTCSDLPDMTSCSGNCGMVENIARSLSDSITDKQLLQTSVMCNGTSDLISTEGPAKPLTTVANQMMDSVAAVVHMPNMTEPLIPMNNTSQYGSVHIRVFSTELANCAAESVRTGRSDSIIDFHRYYYAAQVNTVTGCNFI